eukprot:CAMPEP_0181314366 /NCGR_PEP_ID=MMETSP1101-20121128/14779_1 /TAXON_ID=46948 /ORGANISM="Rhodomonas abbreviata, Strain Caron Lab Isolate" /LENGTH=33 /DNA_ID= /DNA_START= /DNA_END= /DNA_ORIENTATION=
MVDPGMDVTASETSSDVIAGLEVLPGDGVLSGG